MSASGMTSVSTTFRPDLVRSWLRSSRTVSRLPSTSSDPPATKPTTSTRWNGDVSIFGWIGVSTGISIVLEHDASAAAATRLTSSPAARAVIEFLEVVEVLLDRNVVRLERERLGVSLAGLLELPLVLVSDGEIVEGGGVGRIEFDGLLPAVERFLPEPLLGDFDSELHLGLCLLARPGSLGRDRKKCNDEDAEDKRLSHR